MVRNSLDRRLIVMLFLVSTALNGCLPDPEIDTLEVALVVENRELAFAKTLADRDVEAFQSFVSPEAIFFTGNEPIIGRKAIVQAWAPLFEGDTAPFSWYPEVVQVLESGHLALTSGPVTSATGEALGRFNSIWRMDADGQWRVVFDKGS